MKKLRENGLVWWWRNVFVYHYARYVILGAAALAMLGFLIYDSVKNKVDYDLSIAIIAGYGGFSEERLAPMRELAERVAGDINGDGEVNIEFYVVNLSESDVEYNRFEIVLSNSEQNFMLILTDNNQSHVHGERGDFDGVSRFGLPLDSDDEWYRVYIGGSPETEAFPTAPNPNGSQRFTDVEYACLQTWKADGDLAKKKAEATVRLVKILAGVEDEPDYIPTE